METGKNVGLLKRINYEIKRILEKEKFKKYFVKKFRHKKEAYRL